jgi:hypothetical protein
MNASRASSAQEASGPLSTAVHSTSRTRRELTAGVVSQAQQQWTAAEAAASPPQLQSAAAAESQLGKRHAMIGMLLLVAPLTASGMNVTNTVVFPGNKDAKGPACQSWW